MENGTIWSVGVTGREQQGTVISRAGRPASRHAGQKPGCGVDWSESVPWGLYSGRHKAVRNDSPMAVCRMGWEQEKNAYHLDEKVVLKKSDQGQQ